MNPSANFLVNLNPKLRQIVHCYFHQVETYCSSDWPVTNYGY